MINGKQYRIALTWQEKLRFFPAACREWLREQGFRWRRG